MLPETREEVEVARKRCLETRYEIIKGAKNRLVEGSIAEERDEDDDQKDAVSEKGECTQAAPLPWLSFYGRDRFETCPYPLSNIFIVRRAGCEATQGDSRAPASFQEWLGRDLLARLRLYEMTRYPVVVTLLLQGRLVLGAHLDGYGAPSTEPTPAWRIDRAGHVSHQDDPVPFSSQNRVRRGHARQERPGVGMERFTIEVARRRPLDHLAQIHHGHAVADVAHHPQVVRNK